MTSDELSRVFEFAPKWVFPSMRSFAIVASFVLHREITETEVISQLRREVK